MFWFWVSDSQEEIYEWKYMMSDKRSSGIFKIDYYAVRSALGCVNPDLKVFLGLYSLFACMISYHGICAIGIGIGMIYITVNKGGITWRDYMHFLRIPVLFLGLSGLVLLVDVTISMGNMYVSITKETIQNTMYVTMKALTGITCLYMISLNTPSSEIIGVLRRWHVPLIMIELMYLMYRFIFILSETFYHMNVSAKTRLGYSNLKRSYVSFFGICTNLLVIAFQKASISFDAMEARNYEGCLMFLETKRGITRKQMCKVFCYVSLSIMILFMERWLL